MNFDDPIYEGTLLKRYKRFFADIHFNGETIVAHVPNTGSMKGLLGPMSPCRFSKNEDPNRKLKYTLQMIKTATSWVGVNTGLPNKLAWEAFENKQMPHWLPYCGGRLEVKINDQSRIDMALWKNTSFNPEKKWNADYFKNNQLHFVEVKNVTLSEKHSNSRVAQFPDSVTTRGQKHLEELILLMEQGHTCEMLYVIQRSDCDAFEPAAQIDPDYAGLLKKAVKKGLQITAVPCTIDHAKIQLNCQSCLPIQGI